MTKLNWSTVADSDPKISTSDGMFRNPKNSVTDCFMFDSSGNWNFRFRNSFYKLKMEEMAEIQQAFYRNKIWLVLEERNNLKSRKSSSSHIKFEAMGASQLRQPRHSVFRSKSSPLNSQQQKRELRTCLIRVLDRNLRETEVEGESGW